MSNEPKDMNLKDNTIINTYAKFQTMKLLCSSGKKLVIKNLNFNGSGDPIYIIYPDGEETFNEPIGKYKPKWKDIKKDVLEYNATLDFRNIWIKNELARNEYNAKATKFTENKKKMDAYWRQKDTEKALYEKQLKDAREELKDEEFKVSYQRSALLSAMRVETGSKNMTLDEMKALFAKYVK